MIDRASLTNWSVAHPWFRMAYVEQDLVICRALYQRRKGRDLFDLAYAMENGAVDAEAVLRCFRRYMTWNGNALPSGREFRFNMDAKMSMPEYLEDVGLLLRPGTVFDAAKSYKAVRRMFIDKLAD